MSTNSMRVEEAISFDKKAALEAIRAQSKGTASAAQSKRLLEALGRYAVTTFEAMRYLDVYHCPARVLQLRKQGYKIATHWQTVVTEAGEKHRVGLYVLDSGASHETA
jgi:hypothetical protein